LGNRWNVQERTLEQKKSLVTLGKLVQLGFGTNNYDGNTTLCMASAVSGYKVSFGSDGPPGAYEDLEKADVVLLIGANIADNHPILCQYLDANPRRMLIVISLGCLPL